MIRRWTHGLWLLPLGLALAAAAPGCSEPNESEFKEGGGNQQGTADPKYAHGSPETYRQQYEDAKKNAIPPKGAKAAPSKAAPAPTPAKGQ